MKNLLLILLVFCSAHLLAQDFTPEVEAALRKAGNNRPSLEAMLKHYKTTGDKEKYEAACFLVSNMIWHSVGGRVISYDQAVDSFRQAADRSYYALIKGTTAEMQESDPLHKYIKDSANAAAGRVAKYPFSEPQITDSAMCDIEAVSGDFLKKQIDHAFSLRQKVARIRKMPFADFCEYILPYRVIGEYPLVTEAEKFYDVFAKYLQADNDTLSNFKALGERYNRATWWLRHYNGQYPFDTYLGFPDFTIQKNSGLHSYLNI